MKYLVLKVAIMEIVEDLKAWSMNQVVDARKLSVLDRESCKHERL